MSVVLRRMVPADLTAVTELEQDLFGDEAWSRQTLRRELSELPGRFYLVAEALPASGRPPHTPPQGGTVAGYAGLLASDGDRADVLTIAVAGARQGEGIGGMLLDALLAEAVARGCREVFLEVRMDNERAQRLYRRRGFAAVGIRRGYYQPSGADALVMRLETGRLAAGHPPPARPAGQAARGAG